MVGERHSFAGMPISFVDRRCLFPSCSLGQGREGNFLFAKCMGNNMRVHLILYALISCLFLFSEAKAQNVKVNDQLSRQVKTNASIVPLSNQLFGENVSGYTGATAFEQIDVDIPGNNLLVVAFSRKFGVHDKYRSTGAYGGLLGDWDLGVPHLSGVFKESTTPGVSGWQVSTVGNPNKRCSVDRANIMSATPPVAQGTNAQIGAFSSAEYWNGNDLVIPGKSAERMMVMAPANTNRPSDGLEYYWTTNSQWMFACLTSTANGVTGEGFLAVAPDGTKYKFDWFASRTFYKLEKVVTQCTVPSTACNSILNRSEVWIMPTLVTDKFGNTATYTYDPSFPSRLLSIQSSDGRRIDVTYNSTGRIATVSASGRTWTYSYSAAGSLVQVTLPDQSSWSLNTASLAQLQTGYSLYSSCADPPGYATSGTSVATMAHPSGAVGTFTFSRIRHSRSYVPKVCIYGVGSSSYQGISPVIDAVSIISKQIDGPGLTPSVWSFTYSNPMWSYASDCVSTACSSTKTSTITSPDGSWERTTYSNKYNGGEARPLVKETGAGSTVYSKVVIDYQLDATGQPYPFKLGNFPCYYCDDDGETYLPVKTQAIHQDGVVFKADVNSFDAFGRPLSVTKSSSPAP